MRKCSIDFKMLSVEKFIDVKYGGRRGGGDSSSSEKFEFFFCPIENIHFPWLISLRDKHNSIPLENLKDVHCICNL